MTCGERITIKISDMAGGTEEEFCFNNTKEFLILCISEEKNNGNLQRTLMDSENYLRILASHLKYQPNEGI